VLEVVEARSYRLGRSCRFNLGMVMTLVKCRQMAQFMYGEKRANRRDTTSPSADPEKDPGLSRDCLTVNVRRAVTVTVSDSKAACSILDIHCQ
jgi:hypothetical protein